MQNRVRAMWHVLLAVALAGVGAVTGCTSPPESTPSASAPPATEVEAAVVRVIPGADSCVARPGGGQLAYSVVDSKGMRQAYVLSSWDATTPAPLGGPVEGVWLSATRDGIYRVDVGRQVYFSAHGASETVVPDMAGVRRLWAAPSGESLLVESQSQAGYALVDVGTGARRSWRPGKRATGIGEAIWVGDTRLLVQEDDAGPTEGPGVGTVYDVSVAGTRVVSKTAVPDLQTCPVPSPDGTLWAYCESGLVLFDPLTKTKLVEWNAPEWTSYGGPMAPPAWCDATHIAVAREELDGYRVWIIDVSALLAE